MAYDEIGLMYDLADPENPVAREGWHVNVIGSIEGANEFIVTPATPSRVFAGNPPMTCYKFNDKAHFESFLEGEE